MMWSRRHDEALREAGRAIALDPNHSGAHASFGLILHYAGRSEEALLYFDRAAAFDPFFVDFILLIRSQSLYALGRYAEAADISKQRIAANPKTDASRMLLAACLGQMDCMEEAREAWREVLGVTPGYWLDRRRKVLPYKNPEDFEHVVEGLRKAGIA